MGKEKNIQIVQQVFADLETRNIEGVLSPLAEDISWSDPGFPDVPNTKIRNGKAEVRSFFVEVDGANSFAEYVPHEFFADNDAVVVRGFFAHTVRDEATAFASDWIMIWKFRGNKIFNFQVFVDVVAMTALTK